MAEMFELDMGGRFSLESAESYQEWLGNERVAFEWLLRPDFPQGLPQFVNELRSRYESFFGILTSFANRFQNFSAPADRRADLQTHLENVRQSGFLLTSRSPEFRFVETIRKANAVDPRREITAGAAAIYSVVGGNREKAFNVSLLGHADVLKAVLHMGLLRLGATQELPAANESAFESVIEAGRKMFEREENRLDALARAHQEKANVTFGAVEDKGADFEVRTAEAIKDLQTVQHTYQQFMQLQAPVEYWTDKAKDHMESADKYRKSTGRWATGWVLVLLAAYAIGLFVIEYFTRPPQTSFALPLTFYVTGFIAVLTSAALWHMRMVVRLYMSHKHLALDAEERAAMLKTYLALSNEGKISETERALVLAPLFRPSPDGVVKDDGAPAFTLPAALAAILDRR